MAMRILFHSDPPWMPSGFGQQMKQLLPRLVADGHRVGCVCNEGLTHGLLEHDGVTYFPRTSRFPGAELTLHHAAHFAPDVIFHFQEVWTLQATALAEMRRRGLRWIPIVLVDTEPVKPAVLRPLGYAHEVITCAPHGQRELAAAGIDSTHIPLTVDTRRFKPRDQAACRAHFGLPEDVFLFGMVGVNLGNPSRKGYAHALDAFARLRRRRRDCVLYLHTFFDVPGGFPISAYVRELGIAEAVYQLADYDKLYTLGGDEMAMLYSTFDGLLLPSTTEGFGVPIIEAMACGVPVIVTDFAAMRDLVAAGETGYKLRPVLRRFTKRNAYVAEVDASELYHKMAAMMEADLEAMGRRAVRQVRRDFDLSVVWEKIWRPYLARLESTAVC